MGTPLSGPVNFSVDCCVEQNNAGSPVGGLAPYVVSLNSLQGIITIGADGGVSVRSEGNTIYIGADGAAGLGTVTSVNATSSNSNLTVAGGPIVATGTFTFDLAGNLDSISGAVMAADTMLYATGVATFATTTLTAFARTLLDDANAAAARTTLGLIIGTDVQAFSSDLSSFVTAASWSSATSLQLNADLDLTGGRTFTSDGGSIVSLDCENLLVTDTVTVTNSVTAGSFAGDGSGLTNLDAGDIAAGTLAVARGGTGIASYTIGDLLQATGATTLTKLASVSPGSFLRTTGVGSASAWSTVKWPDTLVVGDMLYASTTTAISRLAGVATGNALISGGVGTAFSWGKITTSHTTGIAASGNNGDITGFTLAVTFADTVDFNNTVFIGGQLLDASAVSGNAGEILTSTGTGTSWSTQISLDTLYIGTSLSLEGTITGAGTTGNQTINKPSGTVRIAAAGSSVVVTNSLCTTSSRVMACCSTNDGTAYVKNVVTTSGSFTITLGAAATGETEIAWMLFNIA